MNIAPHDPLPRTSSIIDLLAPSHGGVVATGSQFAGFDRLLKEPQTIGPLPADRETDNSHTSPANSEQPSESSPTETSSTSDKLVQKDQSQSPPKPADSSEAAAESQDDADEDEDADETNTDSLTLAVLVVPQADLPVATPPALAEDGEFAVADETSMLTEDAEDADVAMAPAERPIASAESDFPPAPPPAESQVVAAEAAVAAMQTTTGAAEETLAADLAKAPERPAEESEVQLQMPENEAINPTPAEAHGPDVVDERSAAEDRLPRRGSGESPSTREDASPGARPSAGPLLEPPSASAIVEPVNTAVGATATEGSVSTAGGERASASPAAMPAGTLNPVSAATWRLPAEMLSANPSRGTREMSGPPIDTQRILTRVARAFVLAQDGGGELRLRLSPAELGSLRLEVRVQEGVLQARVEAETPAARSVLIENLPALRERLAEQGVRIERFDVDLMQHSPGGTPDHSRQQSEPQSIPRPAPHERIRTQPQVAEGVAPRAVMAHDLDPRRLNIVV